VRGLLSLGHWGQIRVPGYSPGGGAFLCCVFWQKLRLRVLPFLQKTIGAGLAAGPNAVGSDCQVRSKTLSKGATNVESFCLARPNSFKSGSKLFKKGFGLSA